VKINKKGELFLIFHSVFFYQWRSVLVSLITIVIAVHGQMLLFTTRYLRNQMITYARLDYSRSKITWERPHLHVAGLVDQIGGLDDLLMLYVGSRCTHGQVIQL